MDSPSYDGARAASMRPPAKRRKNISLTLDASGSALASMRPPAKRRKNRIHSSRIAYIIRPASMRPPAKRRKNDDVPQDRHPAQRRLQ